MQATAHNTTFGFLNIDKPRDITAHDVVARLRKMLQIKQIGHGGTLDPMATGVLPIAIGKATRLLRFLDGDKTYLAEITLGMRTDTDDITGKVLDESTATSDGDAVRDALAQFVGTQQQIPPVYSAVHVDGERLYKLARAGTLPDTVPSRKVTVHSIELISYQAPVLTARLTCSAGTYIRSIARDLGNQLNCGGCLSSLRRERAGPFTIASSVTLDKIVPETVALLNPIEFLPLPKCELDERQMTQLLHGQPVHLLDGAIRSESEYIMATFNDALVAIALLSRTADQPFAKIQPEVVIANAT